MAELKSTFTRDDLETLLEAAGDWESLGNQEFSFMQMIEGAPMPPEDHEAYEVWKGIKEHFRSKKKSILASRALRQEKAVFLKAKLMLVRRDMEIDDLFEMTTEAGPVPASIPEAPEVSEAPAPTPTTAPSDAAQKLEQAEFFIRDLGVWDHYEKFLAEQGDSEENSEENPEN
jgi:hypothetical protein